MKMWYICYTCLGQYYYRYYATELDHPLAEDNLDSLLRELNRNFGINVNVTIINAICVGDA